MKLTLALVLLVSVSVTLAYRPHARRGRSTEEEEDGGERGIYYKKETYVEDDEPEQDHHRHHKLIKFIETEGKTAHIAASAAAEKIKAIESLAKAQKHVVIFTIKVGILAQVNGLHALKAAKKAKRHGHHRLAHKVRKQGEAAIRAGKHLLILLKIEMIKCLRAEAELMENFFGVDVASIFGRAKDPRLALKAAHLANKAAKEAHKSQHRAKKAKHHAKEAAKVALEIAENETDKKK